MTSAPQEAFHEVSRSSRPGREQPASSRRQIQAVKDGVRIETVAADYSDELRLLGIGRLLAKCVSPEHADKTPSMTVYTDTQTFKCYGISCGAQGDVIDLVELAEGCETWEAVMHLSTCYGVELPGRPESWYRRLERQRPVRDGIEAAKVYAARRRLYTKFFEPLVLATENEEDRAHDAQLFWELTAPLAAHLVGNMMGVRR